MQKTWGLIICSLLGFGGGIVSLNASTRQFQKATVVRAQKSYPDRPRYGKRTDAPPRAAEYDYDISIRLNCSVYVARYISSFDYLPTVFAPTHSIDVSLDKHVLYVVIPGTGEVKMGIVQRNSEPGDPCNSSH